MHYPLPRAESEMDIVGRKAEIYIERERDRRDERERERERKVRGRTIDGEHRCLCLRTDSGSRSN